MGCLLRKRKFFRRISKLINNGKDDESCVLELVDYGPNYHVSVALERSHPLRSSSSLDHFGLIRDSH